MENSHMVLFGTVVNGVIVPEGDRFPEGARIRMELANEEEDEENSGFNEGTLANYLAAMKKADEEPIEDDRDMSLEEFDAEMKRKHLDDTTVQVRHVRHAAQDRLTPETF